MVSELSKQAPATSGWRRVLGPLYFTGVFWYRAVMLAVRVLPRPLMAPLVLAFSSGSLLLLGRVRRALIANRAVVSGPSSVARAWLRAWRTLRTYAWCMAERNEQFLPGRAFEISREGKEEWDALLASDRGAI